MVMCTVFETRSLTKPGAYLFDKPQPRSKQSFNVYCLHPKAVTAKDPVEMAQSGKCLPCKHEELS